MTFDEPKRRAYLEMLRKGFGRYKAQDFIGSDRRAVRYYLEIHPEFRDEILAAEEEASEPVENVLYQRAIDGEPWAVKMWLQGRMYQRWGEKSVVKHEVSGTIEVTANNIIGELAELREKLLKRAALQLEAGAPAIEEEEDIMDAEVIEEENHDLR